LFSVDKKQKVTLTDKDNAVFRTGNAGPIFGNGDVYICSDGDKKKESCSNLGIAFDVSNV